VRDLIEFKQNIDRGMEYCLEIAESSAFGEENLSSLREIVLEQRDRIEALVHELRDRFQAVVMAVPVPSGA
jgi:hypothetical protein